MQNLIGPQAPQDFKGNGDTTMRGDAKKKSKSIFLFFENYINFEINDIKLNNLKNNKNPSSMMKL